MGVIQLQRRVSKNVVFLIGNGFDLGLGLKTSYRDFIDFYLNKKEDDSLLNSEKEIIRIFKDEKSILSLNVRYSYGLFK